MSYTFHKLSKHPLYVVWDRMKARCLNPTHHSYHRYGGRGITICDEWIDDMKAFYKWCMANGWRKELQLDRIDNNLNYSPSNCKFSTRKENCRHREYNRLIEFNGKKLCLVEWSELTGLRQNTIHVRITRGWSIKKALTTKVRR